MGNYRFKLSDMIPNAWFYKLREMGIRGRKQTTTTTTPSKKKRQQSSSASTTTHYSPKKPNQCKPRKSYYFTRELNPKINNNSPEPPRKQSTKQRTRKRRTCSSVSAGCSCRTTKSESPPEQYSSSPFDDSCSTESELPDPEFRTDRVLIPTESSSFDEMVSLSTSNNNNINNAAAATTDVVIDVDKNSLARRKDDKLEEKGYYEYIDDAFSQVEVELAPIITKPSKLNNNNLLGDPNKVLNCGYSFVDSENLDVAAAITVADCNLKPHHMKKEHKPNKVGSPKIKILKEDTTKKQQQQQQRSGTVRRIFSSSHSVGSTGGVKLRVNSPRIASCRNKSNGRKSVSSAAASSGGNRRSISGGGGSFAIVKSSFNPQKDFRESMVEMIVENNIRASKDLEDLLACYLSLNSDEYHDLIINVFKQIWFDLTETTR